MKITKNFSESIYMIKLKIKN